MKGQAADCLTQAAYNAVVDVLLRVDNDLQVTDLRVDVFRAIAATAPWSYGILYVHDDEAGDDANRWVTWVMKRGMVAAHPDAFLSPHVGEVEDALDESM